MSDLYKVVLISDDGYFSTKDLIVKGNSFLEVAQVYSKRKGYDLFRVEREHAGFEDITIKDKG